MKILVCIDSFKGCLSSKEANNAVVNSAKALGIEALSLAVADGGEGIIEALCNKTVKVKTLNPLGKEIEAEYGILGEKTVIESANCIGLPLLKEEERNPLYTSTYGLGLVIKQAVENGERKFIVGIGGSSTNDGGAGMLMALGYKLLNKEGNEIPLGAVGLKDLYEIKKDGVIKELNKCSFEIACDVENPLCGKTGCSAVFAPQKGAKKEDIPLMDSWLCNYAALLGVDKNIPGAGAAGGLGLAFKGCLKGELKKGTDIIFKEISLEEHIKNADIIITGEGKIDKQTPFGKTPFAIAKLSKKYGKKVLAFCGKKEIDYIEGMDKIIEITPPNTPLNKALEKACENLQASAFSVLKEEL